MPKARKNKTTGLQGDDLLARVGELSRLNKTEKAKACGYFTLTPDGKERANLNEFMTALLDAQGIQLDGQLNGKRGRSMSYRATVQRNGTIVIGSSYTQEMNLEPGDRFEIR